MADINKLILGSGLALVGGEPLTLPVLSSDPGSAVQGDMYFNSASGDIRVYSGSAWTNAIVNIANSDISSSAAIAYSKLNLSGSIVNADVASGAAIAYSKLALTGDIVNADISASAAIVYSKLSLSNSILNADINSSAAIAYSKLNLSGSIVNADIASGAAIAYSKLSLAASIKASDMDSQAASSGYVLTADGLGGASYAAPSTSGGTVTSVALTVPGFLSVSGSPITTSGTLAVSLANEAANKVFAGPATGADAAPTFRSLVAADMPDLSSVYEVVGNFAVRSYNNSISLAGSISSPTTIAALTFAFASYVAADIKYVMIEASTAACRTGNFRVSTDGTICGFADEYAQTAVLGNGLSLSATISGSNVVIQFTGTGANAVTMRCEVTKFVA